MTAEHTTQTCCKCDESRRREGTPQKVGQPCDICGGRGFDYLDRPCRHSDGGDDER